VQRTDSLNDLINFLSKVEHIEDLYGENFGYVLMNMKICCYDLEGVDSKTLIPFFFVLLYFILFFLLFIKTSKIGTRLK